MEQRNTSVFEFEEESKGDGEGEGCRQWIMETVNRLVSYKVHCAILYPCPFGLISTLDSIV